MYAFGNEESAIAYFRKKNNATDSHDHIYSHFYYVKV
jgi:hypothetical protein